MLRPRASALPLGLLAFSLALMATSPARGDDPPQAGGGGGIPARFVLVEEPITTETTRRIRDGVESFVREVEARPLPQDGKRVVPIVVFEVRPGKSEPGSTPLGGAEDLVRYILEEVDHTRVHTVGFVPEPLAGYAVLPVLACDEVAMAADATLGPITPRDRPVDEGVKVRLRSIADKNGREAQLGLFLGMLDPSLDVRRVKTADNQVRYMPAAELDAFRGKAEHAVVEETPVWEAGNRGILTYEMGRGSFVKKQAASRGDVRTAYELDSTADIETGDVEASEMVISGPDHARRGRPSRSVPPREDGRHQRGRAQVPEDLPADQQPGRRPERDQPDRQEPARPEGRRDDRLRRGRGAGPLRRRFLWPATRSSSSKARRSARTRGARAARTATGSTPRSRATRRPTAPGRGATRSRWPAVSSTPASSWPAPATTRPTPWCWC